MVLWGSIGFIRESYGGVLGSVLGYFFVVVFGRCILTQRHSRDYSWFCTQRSLLVFSKDWLVLGWCSSHHPMLRLETKNLPNAQSLQLFPFPIKSPNFGVCCDCCLYKILQVVKHIANSSYWIQATVLLEALRLWNRCDLQIYAIDFPKWGHCHLLPPLNSWPPPHSHIFFPSAFFCFVVSCVCWHDCVSLGLQVSLSADTVLELNKTFTSRPVFELLSSVSREAYLPLTRFCLVLVAQLVTAHACSSMWPNFLPPTV